MANLVTIFNYTDSKCLVAYIEMAYYSLKYILISGRKDLT